MGLNFKGKLSNAQWRELVTLEYVLTWGYTKNEKRDTERLLKLRRLKE